MVDFWINVLLSLTVTFAVILIDWIANQLISTKRRLIQIPKKMDELVAKNASRAEIQREITKFSIIQETNLVWGNDLASIAFSLDLAVLGIWISTPNLFPFFSLWNSPNVPREIPVWLTVIFSHFVLLALSVFFKHSHISKKESIPIDQFVNFPKYKWFNQNKHMLNSNIIGFVSLLSSFLILTNSIHFP